MRTASLLILAALSLATGAAAQSPPSGGSALGSAWLAAPTITDLKAVYPPQARQQHIEGQVVLSCKVIATGDLKDCAVLSETPPAVGFGKAALALVSKYRMNPKAADGSSMEGAVIALPVRFQITEEGPAPPLG